MTYPELKAIHKSVESYFWESGQRMHRLEKLISRFQENAKKLKARLIQLRRDTSIAQVESRFYFQRAERFEAALRMIESRDRTRGYPTGKEWGEILEAVQKALVSPAAATPNQL